MNNKEQLIINVIMWNLDQNRFDHDTGEEEMIVWIIDTYKYLNGQSELFLISHQYANSLLEEGEV